MLSSRENTAVEWWQDAVVYQVYLRSFADANDDGIGDLPGLRSHLSDLADLGIDAIWLNPCYLSPQRDHGYDIADYQVIDPAYGTIDDLDALLREAHDLGLRVLMDMVANHCSDQHAWFQEALASAPGHPSRERFLFRDGRGESGQIPPNNWQSVFGGAAWTQVVEPDARQGQWYLHAFDSGQPDFNWRNPDVAEYFEAVLRFWYDRGVDGFRIDVAHGLFKSATMADWPGAEDGAGGHNQDMWDQPEVHDVYRRWRAIADGYAPATKYYVGEIWVPTLGRLIPYLAPDELHQAFNFDLLVQPWHAGRMAAAINRGLAQGAATDGAPAWTLSNHDVHRTTTRYGQSQDLTTPSPTDMLAAARRAGEPDLALGVRRARAAAMLLLALPGTVYLYQGEELGLPEVLDLPDAARQDPIWLRSEGAEIGRDGCRVPLPWIHDAPYFGFMPASTSSLPWLPQPKCFGEFAADLQRTDAESTLSLYAHLIASRRQVFGRGTELHWLDAERPELLAFRRGHGVCVVNFADEALSLPREWDLTPTACSLALAPTSDVHTIPANGAAWFAAARVAPTSPATTAIQIPLDSMTSQLETLAI
jgi:alpha-glucosidase